MKNPRRDAAVNIADTLAAAEGRAETACLCNKRPTHVLDDGTETAVLVEVKDAATGVVTLEPAPALAGFTAAGDVCPGCLGYLWHWTDGVPPTVCPSNAKKVPPPKTLRGALMPCGRKGAACPGCGRAPELVGGVADVQATIVARRQTTPDNA